MHELKFDNTNITLHQLLKIEALYRNMSLPNMAKDANISYALLFNTNSKKPTLDTYEKLSKYLNIEIGDLLAYKIKL